MVVFPAIACCLGDDLFDLLLFFMPRHLPWPPYIVPDPTRSRIPEYVWLETLSSEVVDCGTAEVNGLYDGFYWSRKYMTEMGVTLFDSLWQLTEWPLLRFAPSVPATRDRWKHITLTPLINECAAINIVSIIPPFIMSLFFYLELSFAFAPFVRLAADIFTKTQPLVKRCVSAALTIYNMKQVCNMEEILLAWVGAAASLRSGYVPPPPPWYAPPLPAPYPPDDSPPAPPPPPPPLP